MLRHILLIATYFTLSSDSLTTLFMMTHRWQGVTTDRDKKKKAQ